MAQEKNRHIHSLSRLTLSGLAVSLASVAVAIMSGVGSRWGLWHFSTGFKILGGAALGGGLAALISLISLVCGLRKGLWRSVMLSFIGLALGLNAFGIPYCWYHAAKQLPKIHDITTDTKNPPQFVAILPLRKKAPNPPDYGGPEIAQRQQEAYPDIKPLILDAPVDKAFDRALAAARKMSWKIVDADVKQRRIEATDTTLCFGFKDDIVISITALDHQSRIDVRSESRVGLSDVGANATRIREYLKRLSHPS